MGGGGKSTSKPYFFEGQKDIAKSIFAPGGPIASLLGGAPDVGYEAGINRGTQQLNQNLASAGLFGQPLGARAQVDFLSKAAVGREQNRLSNLLGAIQPAGSSSVSGGKGGLFGL